MKHILAPILLLAFLFPSVALGEEVTFDDLVEREGLWYKKFTDVPFTGKVVSYYENGQLSAKGDYKNGKEEGPWVYYWDNGQVNWRGDYKNGKKEGPWVGYSMDGSVWKGLTGTFKNDKKVD